MTEEEFAEEEVYLDPEEPGAAIVAEGGGRDSPFKDVVPPVADSAPPVRKLRAAPARPAEFSNPDRPENLSELEAQRRSTKAEVQDERLPAVVGGDGSLVTCDGEDALLGGCYGEDSKPRPEQETEQE